MLVKVLSFCLSVTFVLSQHVTLHGNCSSAPFSPMEVWGIERDPLNCSLGKTRTCRGNLPSQFQGEAVKSPGMLTVEGVLIPDPDGNLAPQMVVTWELPSSAASIEKLKGFNIEIRRLKGPRTKIPDFLCRIYDFSDSKFTAKDTKLKFRKKEVGFLGGDGVLYRIDLFTLPRSSTSIPETRYLKLQPVQVKRNTSNWYAAVSYSVRQHTSQVTVLFSLAPESYGFETYLVQLVDDLSDMYAVYSCNIDPRNGYHCQGRNYDKKSKGATSVSHTFFEVPNGTYTVWIQPHDPDRWNVSSCLCYSKVANNKSSCVPCATTHTGEIIVEARGTYDPQKAKTSSPKGKSSHGRLKQDSHVEDNSVITIVAVVLGTLTCGLFLVVMIGFCLWRRNHYAAKAVSVSSPGEHKKMVYLVYTEDHNDHINVVTRFADFLNVRCKCQVFFLPWFRSAIRVTGCYDWIINHIDKADYVIIINSQAAFKLFHARNSSISLMLEEQGPEGDTFSPAITHVMTKSGNRDFFKKTILAYFDYTQDEFVLKELSPGVQYKLPEHLSQLLCHIHEVDVSRMVCGQPLKNLQITAEGRDLVEAINKAKHFEKSDYSWFEKRFNRSDSAYDSMSVPDWHQYQHDIVDSVSVNHFESSDYNVASYSLYDVDDEAKSTVTYTTNYTFNRQGNAGNPVPPSDADTVTSTEYINMQLVNINHHSMEDRAYGNHISDTGYKRNGYTGVACSDEDFYPPSEV